MEKRSLFLLVLALFFMAVSAAEWYQQGNPTFLTPRNFDLAIKEANKYKFVKYFTHTCRYCRMLKQVE
jgi:thioredoxin-related protein